MAKNVVGVTKKKKKKKKKKKLSKIVVKKKKKLSKIVVYVLIAMILSKKRKKKIRNKISSCKCPMGVHHVGMISKTVVGVDWPMKALTCKKKCLSSHSCHFVKNYCFCNYNISSSNVQ